MARKAENMQIHKISYEFTLRVCRMLEDFPDKEKNNLIDQLRRASTSITLNIVEGTACRTDKEFLYFLGYAFRSLKETKTLLNLSKDLGYITKENHKRIYSEADKLAAKLFLFIASIERKIFSKQQLKEGYSLFHLKNKLLEATKRN